MEVKARFRWNVARLSEPAKNHSVWLVVCFIQQCSRSRLPSINQSFAREAGKRKRTVGSWLLNSIERVSRLLCGEKLANAAGRRRLRIRWTKFSAMTNGTRPSRRGGTSFSRTIVSPAAAAAASFGNTWRPFSAEGENKSPVVSVFSERAASC